MTEQEYEEEIERRDNLIDDLINMNGFLASERNKAKKENDGFHFMIKNKYMFWEEFDRVEIRDQQGNYKGAGKDHISAIDDAMGEEK